MAGSTIVCPAPMRFLVHGVPRRSTLLGTVVPPSLRKKRAKRNARPGTRRWVPAVRRAAPIEPSAKVVNAGGSLWLGGELLQHRAPLVDRKSTRLNSSHVEISYAVFCLKK